MMRMPLIPGYQLLNRLGGGLMTAVYSARELDTDRPCAIKVLRTDWHDEVTAVKLLQREARAGLLVQHAHLVRIRYAQVTRPPYYLVMDLLPGESLRQRLRRDYRCMIRESIWISRQIAEALAALHRARFVHGDVKPDNIHLTDSGEAVLLDLGFAHRPGENSAILEQGYILGTVDYLAPELCARTPTESTQSDIFALGVTLFEMLTGELPYPRGSVSQTMRRHECDPPVDIANYHLPLPEPLIQLTRRLLAHRPDMRPKSYQVVQQLIQLEIHLLHQRRAA